MATLQKFKLLATQCSVLGSPTRSPTTSPVIHIRRRKTLRMLLGGGKSTGSVFNHRFIHHQPPPPRRVSDPDRSKLADQKPASRGKESSNIGVRLKLKDLFVSSPPTKKVAGGGEEEQRLLPAVVTRCSNSGDCGGGGLVVARRGGGGSVRPFSATLRQRLLMRRAWRPVLVAIPEQSP